MCAGQRRPPQPRTRPAPRLPPPRPRVACGRGTHPVRGDHHRGEGRGSHRLGVPLGHAPIGDEGGRHPPRDRGDAAADPRHGAGRGAHRSRRRDLSLGVRAGQCPHPFHPPGHREPRGHPLDRVRPVRARHVRAVPALRRLDPGRLAHPRDHDPADRHQHRRGGAARRAHRVPHRGAQPRRKPVAGRQDRGAAAGHARHHHGRHPRPAARCGRNRADPLHRGRVLPAAAAAFAVRSDHGAALPPVRHQHAGARACPRA